MNIQSFSKRTTEFRVLATRMDFHCRCGAKIDSGQFFLVACCEARSENEDHFFAKECVCPRCGRVSVIPSASASFPEACDRAEACDSDRFPFSDGAVWTRWNRRDDWRLLPYRTDRFCRQVFQDRPGAYAMRRVFVTDPIRQGEMFWPAECGASARFADTMRRVWAKLLSSWETTWKRGVL